MLLAALASSPSPAPLRAVHVDHGLRAGSADEFEVVAAAADRLGVPARTVRVDVGHDAAHPELCLRCVSNVDGPGETRAFA